jgi:glycosyltransferase involved in cell wall biosynthesis
MSRVCIVRHNYYPEEAHVRRDAETLVRHGFDVDVICLRKKGQNGRERVGAVNVYRLPVQHRRKGAARYIFEYSAFLLMASWTLGWLSLGRRYEVVEVVSMPEVLIFAALSPKLLGAKVVLYVFDHTPETFGETFKFGLDHPVIRLLRLVSSVCLRLADHVITAELLSQKIVESRGVPSSKVSVILNVPDENVFFNKTSSANNGNGFCLITHGSLLEKYGVQTLIKAIPLLIKDVPELKVMVVGDGEYRQKLQELAQTLGVSDYVHFTGLVQFEEVAGLIGQAHIGVVSILTEANPMLPNKLFEYLALGKPTVVARSPCVEAYFDEKSVMFYEPANEYDLGRCILELYRNPRKRAMLAASGSAVYQEYRWSKMKYKYLKVYDQLTGGKHPLLSEENHNTEGEYDERSL